MSGTPNRIREIRQQKGKSGTWLAEKLGISPQYLYAMEKGQKSLKVEYLKKIADLLDVSTDQLLVNNDDSKEERNDDIIDMRDDSVEELAFMIKSWSELPEEDRQLLSEHFRFLYWRAKQRKKEKGE